MFVLTILENNNWASLKFSLGRITVLQKKKKANYRKVRVKLTNTWLSKLKSVAKNKTGTTLTWNKKNFEGEELPHELFLTTRQTTKIRNGFASNIDEI